MAAGKIEEYSFVNSTIFVDLWVSPNFGVSNGKLGLDFLLSDSISKICYFY